MTSLAQLSQQQLQQQLLAVGEQVTVTVLDVLPSTNQYALRLHPQRQPQVVIARQQSAGHGQNNRVFLSPLGGLYLSVWLPVTHEALVAFRFTAAAGVALVQALQEKLGITVQLKWVNDVLYRHQKIAGILTQGQLAPSDGQLSGVVIGIGLNYLSPQITVNQPVTTLKEVVTAGQVTLNEFTAYLIICLFKQLRQPLEQTISQYQTLTGVIGRRILATADTANVGQTVVALDNNGTLMLTNGRHILPGQRVQFT